MACQTPSMPAPLSGPSSLLELRGSHQVYGIFVVVAVQTDTVYSFLWKNALEIRIKLF